MPDTPMRHKPVLLKENTIFLVEKTDLKEVGTVLEVPTPTYSQTTYLPERAWDSKSTHKDIERYTNFVTLIANFLTESNLSFIELDILLKSCFGIPLSGLLSTDYERVANLFDVLLDYIEKDKAEIWEDVLLLDYKDEPQRIYERFSLQFPYMFNSLELITKVRDTMDEEAKRDYPAVQ